MSSDYSPFSAALGKLEFFVILERIKRYAESDAGKRRVESLRPATSIHEVDRELALVSEAKEVVNAEGAFPLEGLKDISVALKKTGVENQPLSEGELLAVASVLLVSRRMQAFLQKRKSEYQLLAEFLPRLHVDKVLEYNITGAIDEEGRVRDSASKRLAQIRRNVASLGEQLRKMLVTIMKRVSEEEEVLQEEIVTTRDGRLVIPVKTEFKRKVPGFIHSSSSSGATVFIEPAETLELNNTIRENLLEEQREIFRILSDLTRQVAEIRDPLERTHEALSELDCVVARAKYSIEILGSAPLMGDDARIRLRQARHPALLQRHKRQDVVPLDVELASGSSTLVITGPNAGGKTVAMKTIGLLQLMAQSGIHIPASSDSSLGMFEGVFVDIGDDQSIENDLSTFSSHLLNLKSLLESAGERSLVLIDEIGAGTDPSEGGALAAEILSELTTRGAVTVTTTHHGVLKAFAHQTPGIVNGSMEFDQATLTPTYKFVMGIPGSSYALELAQRLGLSKNVVEGARSRMSGEEASFASLLVELESMKQRYEESLREVQRVQEDASSLKQEYDARMRDVKSEIAELRKTARIETEELFNKAKAKIEQTIREIKESQAEKKATSVARAELEKTREELVPAGSEYPASAVLELNVGDSVRISGTSVEGTVLEIRENSVTIAASGARISAQKSSLERVAPRTDSGAPRSKGGAALPEARTHVDVRGLLGDEALVEVEHFLDEAFAAGLHRVHIVHGKGTGALRKKISEFLKTYAHAQSFELAPLNEGGTGATIVLLKDE